jgi:isopentenyldiphosphate isomerase
MQAMELLDTVDQNGIPIGKTVEREIAHREGIRHRTSHVWILRKHDGKAQVLLRKRSISKDSYSGCYDISSAGHIPSGESFIESALRELKEKLGVHAAADELIYCGRRKFEYHKTFQEEEFWDNQVSNVYVLKRNIEYAELILQRSEIEIVLWMDLDICFDMVKNKKAPNCILIEELKMIASAVENNEFIT